MDCFGNYYRTIKIFIMDNTIIEGNKVIVKFLGCKIDKTSYSEWWYEIKDGHFGYIDNLEYHSCWDWLMPVCKKWDNLYQGKDINKIIYKEYELLSDKLDDAVTLYIIEPV